MAHENLADYHLVVHYIAVGGLEKRGKKEKNRQLLLAPPEFEKLTTVLRQEDLRSQIDSRMC